MEGKVLGATKIEKQLVDSRFPLIPQLHPLLVICDLKHEERQTFFSISENRWYTRIIPDMRNKLICCCYQGWLVLEDYDSVDGFLLNAVSMEKVQLPPLDIPFYNICIFSLTPSDPNCRVFFIDGFNRCFWSCQLGDDEFVKQELILGNNYLASATTFEGKIYGLTLPGYTLVTADFTDATLQFRELVKEVPQKQSQADPGFYVDYLIESCGELLFVHMMYLGTDCLEVVDFKIYSVDFSKMAWVRIKSIGQRAIFLGQRRGMSCSAAEVGIKGNCIYYYLESDSNLYVLDLEDQSISMSQPCPIVSSRRSVLNWVMIPGTNK